MKYRLERDEFGYTRRHYIEPMFPNPLSDDDRDIPEWLEEEESEDEED